MNDERTWTILVCPECGRDDRHTPIGRTKHWCLGVRCGGTPVPVVVVPASTVVPLATLREVLDQYRDIVGGMYAVRAKDPVTACGVLRRGMADATRLRAALLDEYEGTTE